MYFADRARMTVLSAPGISTFALGIAVPTWITFTQAGIPNGALVPYLAIEEASFEVGVGTYDAGTLTLTRDTVFRNSSGGTSKIAFTIAATVAVSATAASLFHQGLTDLSEVDSTAYRIPVMGSSGLLERALLSTVKVTPTGETTPRYLYNTLAGSDPTLGKYEKYDLEYFLRRQANTAAGHRAAVIAVFTEAYNNGQDGLWLKCDGIPLTFSEPLRLRTDILNFSRQGFKITGLNIDADTGGTWSHLDYLFSLAGGASNDQVTRVIFEDYYAHIHSLPIVGLHVGGAFHFSVYRPVIKGLSGTDLTDYAIGFLCGRYVGDRGEGVSVVNGVAVNTHGVRVFEADISDSSGNDDTTSVALQMEPGDADIQGGWIQSAGVGLIAYGGINIRGMHWSMSTTSAGDRKPGIIYRGGNAELSIHDTELDKCYIILDARTNQVGEANASDASFARISMSGLKFSSGGESLPASLNLHDGSTTVAASGLAYGQVTFVARQANTTLDTSINILSDWHNVAVADLIGFAKVGAGTFDSTSVASIMARSSATPSGLGKLPGDMRLRVAGNDFGEIQFHPNRSAGPAARMISTGNDSSVAAVIEGSQTNSTAYAEVEFNNRANGTPGTGIARLKAYRDGGGTSTKLGVTTMAAGVETEWLTLDKAGLLNHSGAATVTGRVTAGFLNIPNAGTLTLAGGAITVTGSRHAVDTQAAAATDNLVTINGGTDGDLLILRGASSARDVTLKDGTGNLMLNGDFTLSNTDDRIMLINASSNWFELSRSDNA